MQGTRLKSWNRVCQVIIWRYGCAEGLMSNEHGTVEKLSRFVFHVVIRLCIACAGCGGAQCVAEILRRGIKSECEAEDSSARCWHVG